MVDAVEKLKEDLMKEIVPIIFDTHREIVMNTPVDTGRLRGSIIVEQVSDDEYIIGTNVEYAEAVELGMGPHVIVPVNKEALHFFVNGEEVFAKKVNHPGFDGRHMFLKGVQYFENEVKKINH